MKSPRLETVLKYRHPGVVARLRADFGYGPAESRQIFEDLLRFLWLSCEHHQLVARRSPAVRDLPVLKMADFWQPLDDAWHTFLLFTEDYLSFCERHFGAIISHIPEPRRRRRRHPRAPSARWSDRFQAFARPRIGAPATTRFVAGYSKRFPSSALFRRRLRALRASYGSPS